MNGQVRDAVLPIDEHCELQLLTWNDADGKSTMWHSSAHLMAEALEFYYPGIKLAIGPPVNSGFYYDVDLMDYSISEKDLELRGPGEIDGTRQSGAADLKIADIIKDVGLMELTRNKAIQLLQSDPNLQTPQNENLRNFLLSRKDKEVWSKIS